MGSHLLTNWFKFFRLCAYDLAVVEFCYGWRLTILGLPLIRLAISISGHLLKFSHVRGSLIFGPTHICISLCIWPTAHTPDHTLGLQRQGWFFKWLVQEPPASLWKSGDGQALLMLNESHLWLQKLNLHVPLVFMGLMSSWNTFVWPVVYLGQYAIFCPWGILLWTACSSRFSLYNTFH